MLFSDDIEFVRRVYARNRLTHPSNPSHQMMDNFVGLEIDETEMPVEIPVDKVAKLKALSRIQDTLVYTPGYTTKLGKQVKGYFRKVK